MRIHQKHQPLHGLTLIEVLVIIVVLAVLFGLLIPGHNIGPKGRRIQCFSNLKQCSLALRMWAEDNNSKLPFQVSTNQGGSMEYTSSNEVYRHFQVLSNEIGSSYRILWCSADQERSPTNDFEHLNNQNLSYFLALNPNGTNAWNVFAGDRNLAAKNQNYVNGNYLISTNQLLTWGKGLHHPGGNLAFADGHVEQCDNQKLAMRMSDTRQPTNWLAFP